MDDMYKILEEQGKQLEEAENELEQKKNDTLYYKKRKKQNFIFSILGISLCGTGVVLLSQNQFSHDGEIRIWNKAEEYIIPIQSEYLENEIGTIMYDKNTMTLYCNADNKRENNICNHLNKKNSNEISSALKSKDKYEYSVRRTMNVIEILICFGFGTISSASTMALFNAITKQNAIRQNKEEENQARDKVKQLRNNLYVPK